MDCDFQFAICKIWLMETLNLLVLDVHAPLVEGALKLMGCLPIFSLKLSPWKMEIESIADLKLFIDLKSQLKGKQNGIETYLMTSGNKLRLYRQYKNIPCVESYVTDTKLSRYHRHLICQLQSGSLPLAIETGRFSKPPITLKDRLCTNCDMNVIEDEIHKIQIIKKDDMIRAFDLKPKKRRFTIFQFAFVCLRLSHTQLKNSKARVQTFSSSRSIVVRNHKVTKWADLRCIKYWIPKGLYSTMPVTDKILLQVKTSYKNKEREETKSLSPLYVHLQNSCTEHNPSSILHVTPTSCDSNNKAHQRGSYSTMSVTDKILFKVKTSYCYIQIIGNKQNR
ncbi:hypothetical protein KUTeg_010197 [Tegillarca granosa]|uniref:Uncharacterized protein n=1 Tax=Tegillarca granosa TaxID=220873 RepID=A0ABQ9F677_TEGGR|nr:hypothetical protein KUTeg_010197 [Tegillarca granosa]